MLNIVEGPNVVIRFGANELSSNTYIYYLPDGYSINSLVITSISNILHINNAYVSNNTKLVFPVVNYKSPSTLTLFVADTSKSTELRFTIEKFGRIPDEDYFDTAFKPIRVTGDDGNEYNVIPSDQFK